MLDLVALADFCDTIDTIVVPFGRQRFAVAVSFVLLGDGVNHRSDDVLHGRNPGVRNVVCTGVISSASWCFRQLVGRACRQSASKRSLSPIALVFNVLSWRCD